jgi:hypothetical protein
VDIKWTSESIRKNINTSATDSPGQRWATTSATEENTDINIYTIFKHKDKQLQKEYLIK